jgi:hypothetical protein
VLIAAAGADSLGLSIRTRLIWPAASRGLEYQAADHRGEPEKDRKSRTERK